MNTENLKNMFCMPKVYLPLNQKPSFTCEECGHEQEWTLGGISVPFGTGYIDTGLAVPREIQEILEENKKEIQEQNRQKAKDTLENHTILGRMIYHGDSLFEAIKNDFLEDTHTGRSIKTLGETVEKLKQYELVLYDENGERVNLLEYKTDSDVLL